MFLKKKNKPYTKLFMAALFPIGKLGDFNMLQLVKLVNYNSTKDLLL